MQKIRHQLGGLLYRGGCTSCIAPKIPLGESTKKVNKDGQCIDCPQEQSVPKTVEGSKIHLWQGVLLPTCRNNLSGRLTS